MEDNDAGFEAADPNYHHGQAAAVDVGENQGALGGCTEKLSIIRTRIGFDCASAVHDGVTSDFFHEFVFACHDFAVDCFAEVLDADGDGEFAEIHNGHAWAAGKFGEFADEAAALFFINMQEGKDESANEFGAWTLSSTAFVVTDH